MHYSDHTYDFMLNKFKLVVLEIRKTFFELLFLFKLINITLIY